MSYQAHHADLSSGNDDGGETDLLRLDLQFCFPIYAASNLLNRLSRPILKQFGLTYPQYLVMLVLWEQEQQTVGELGAALHLDSGTLTPVLKRMQQAGLLRRDRVALDERRVQVAPTQAGSSLRDAVATVPRTLGAALGIAPETVETLRRNVQKMVAVLACHEMNDDRATPIGAAREHNAA